MYDTNPSKLSSLPEIRRSDLCDAPAPDGVPARRCGDWMVPIRSLGPNHRQRIAAHLKALSPNDRYYRFGYVVNDEQIDRYVAALDFERDEIFGIYNRHLQLIAVAHLAYAPAEDLHGSAEFGVSVLGRVRGRGFGQRLFERAMMHAQNQGVALMHLHVLSENAVMLKIARRNGAVVENNGTDSQARLRLPLASLNSRVTEIVEQHMAEVNYQIKLGAWQFRQLLASQPETGQGVKRDEPARDFAP